MDPLDAVTHVSSRSGEACGELLYPVTLLYLYFYAQSPIALYTKQELHSKA